MISNRAAMPLRWPRGPVPWLLALATLMPTNADAAEGPGGEVGLFGRFEATIINDRDYGDPYAGATLDVIFHRPDGSMVPFWGFHDGGRIWKARFRPDQPGDWRFEATFSDGMPGLAGSFRCIPSDQPGPVGVFEANPTWFGRRGGGALMVRGLHVGDRFFARNWPDDQRSTFLDWARGQGYNALSIASHLLNRDEPNRGRGWETPDLWPLDAAEFRRMETILDDLDRRGFVVYPFAGFFGQDSDYPRDPADQERYLRYALARLGPYGNLLFNVAGPEPNLPGKKRWMAVEDVERLGRLVRRLDPFDHPLSVHNWTGVEPFRDSDWSTFGTVQGPKTVDRRELARKLLEWHHPAKPLLAQETLWSGNVNHIRRIGADYSDVDLRKNAYVILFSGANIVFADNDGDSSTGFSGTLDLDDRRQGRHDILRRVWDTFDSFPFGRMRPRPDLVDRGVCLAEPGQDYLIYLDEAGPLDVNVEGGPFDVHWIDPRDPSVRVPGGLTRAGLGLRPPVDSGDWLVHLTRSERR